VALCSWQCPGIDENFSDRRECSGAVTIIAHRALVPDSMGKALRAREQANVATNENRGFARRLVPLPLEKNCGRMRIVRHGDWEVLSSRFRMK
jgi:hypothetical protein